jgi:tetratricopeptide (TPR) repeat protein
VALFQDGRYEEVINLLTRPRCEMLRANDVACKQAVRDETYPKVANVSCPCFAEANPGFAKLPRGADLLLDRAYVLLEQAHCKVAIGAVSVTPVDNMKALRHWKTAIELARRHSDVEDILMGIRNDIAGRANYMIEAVNLEDATSSGALYDAVELVELAYDEGWDNEDRVLWFTLLDLLLLRAYFFSNIEEDHERARRDAIRGYSMEPTHLRAIFVLCKVNWFYAWRLHDRGLKPQAEALIREIEERLKEGDELFPDNSDLATCHKNLKELRDYMAEVGGVTLESLIKEAPPLPETTVEQQRRSKLAEASYHEARKNYAEAIKLYEEILQKDPDNDEVNARMAYCYNSWIIYETDNGVESPERIRQLTREAVKRFPNSDLFAGYAGLVSEE